MEAEGFGATKNTRKLRNMIVLQGVYFINFICDLFIL